MLSIEKVKLKDLTKICPNYFYIKYDDNGKTGYNFLWCSFDVHNNITLVDPMDLTKVLTSLAYKVKDNSTFAGVARGLNLPSSVIEEAELMDKALCDGVFKKGNKMENIKEKIQKLLNLATSDNEHEAALALAKATELMNKWNLDQATVQGTKIETTEIYMPFYKWTSENQVLVNLLAKLCDGFCLFGSGNKQQDRFAKILISGRPRDLENFRYLYDFINTKMWKESEKYKLKIRNSNQGKNNLEVKSFRIGFLKKIEEKLSKSKNDFFSVNKSLVSIDSETKRKEAKEFLMNSRENVKTVTSTTRVVDRHLEAGKEIAESVDLNVAINGGKGISKIGYKK